MAQYFLITLLLYVVIGILFSIPFLIKGAKKIDEGVNGTSFWLKVLLWPGTVLFWPILLRNWINIKK